MISLNQLKRLKIFQPKYFSKAQITRIENNLDKKISPNYQELNKSKEEKYLPQNYVFD